MINNVGNKVFSESGLAEIVEAKLKTYFNALNGARPASGLYDSVIREIEKPLFCLVLKHTQGNKAKASELLGINRNTLYKKLKELGLE